LPEREVWSSDEGERLLLDDYLLMVAWSGMVVDLGIQHNMWNNGVWLVFWASEAGGVGGNN
jgi:hypothetical protein